MSYLFKNFKAKDCCLVDAPDERAAWRQLYKSVESVYGWYSLGPGTTPRMMKIMAGPKTPAR